MKEWFTFECNKARSSSSSSSHSNPYTCPTCRATVKDARHNATVTTLLEMFLAANPGRGKSQEDKDDIAKSYKPGENILPQFEPAGGRRSKRREEEDRADEEAERRQLEEARERSIRETRGTAAQVGTRLAAPTSGESRNRSRSRESREQRRRDDERREERRERRRRAEVAEAHLREREAAASATPTAPVVSLTTENLTAARLSPPTASPRHPSAVEARQRERQVVPQTSLRSLMSSSESGAGTGDSLEAEQILQQMLQDGLLEGIDLHHLNPAQEDALSERIAEAYRQRQQNRGTQPSPTPREGTRRENGRTSSRTRVRERQQEAERRHHQRSHSAQNSSIAEPRQAVNPEDRRPPTARTRFHNTDTAFTTNRRRASDNERRQASPTSRSHRTNPEDSVCSATRSAIDLSERPRTSDDPRESRPRHPSDTRRTNIEPEQLESASERWRAAQSDARLSSGELPNPARHAQLPSDGNTSVASTTIPRSRNAVLRTESPTSSTRNSSHSMAVLTPPSTATTVSDLHTRVARHSSEPSISCSLCSRRNMQYYLHKHCSQCSTNICLRCYRTAPSSAFACSLDSIAESPPGRSGPPISETHTFSSRKYLRPADAEQALSLNSSARSPSTNDPSSRIQEGKFCDLCHSFANVCYWSCDVCNKGDWGFCNSCVNSHYCCTHPLLPLAHKSFAPKTPTLHQGSNADSGVITLTPSLLHADVLPTSSTTRSHLSASSSSSSKIPPDFVPLTFTTDCDICTYPIPPSHTRFHCPKHLSSSSSSSPIQNSITNQINANHIDQGDYDICTPCYLSLLKQRKIRKDDGPNGWRRCPQGHRMIVIGFEDAVESQRRVVVNDLVGGWSLREREGDDDTKRSGQGAGKWSWIEEEQEIEDSPSSRQAGGSHAIEARTIKTQTRTSRLRSSYPNTSPTHTTNILLTTTQPSSPSSSTIPGPAPSKFPPILARASAP